MVLKTNTRIFIETLKTDDMELIIGLMFFFLPECFACTAEQKSGNPAAET